MDGEWLIISRMGEEMRECGLGRDDGWRVK